MNIGDTFKVGAHDEFCVLDHECTQSLPVPGFGANESPAVGAAGR